ncbi:tetratricopeptide repeat protein [Streptomyces sp. NPDC001549]|uniref:tetratricopeptide repeat protein n=1 Tax=Streptomyces sp. NPDC001549 TaxID=3364586 RepID=UPI0036D00647
MNTRASRRIIGWSIAAVLVGVLTILAYVGQFEWTTAWAVIGATLIVAAAAFAIGMLLGFIFGLPRTFEDSASGLQTDDPPARRRLSLYSWSLYRSNTNLEQISDWLTKILVGVGLVQLIKLPAAAQSLGRWLKPALGNVPSTEAFAIGLTAYYTVTGFFVGYLLTRLCMAAALSSADAGVHELQRKIQTLIFAQKGEDPEKKKVEELGKKVERFEEETGLRLDANAYVALAQQLKDVGKYDSAVEAYLRVAELRPEDPAPLDQAGVVRGKFQARYKEANELYRRALLVDPSYAGALYNSACNSMRQDKRIEALGLLAAAIESDSESRDRAKDESRPGEVFHPLADDPTFQILVGTDNRDDEDHREEEGKSGLGDNSPESDESTSNG